MVKNVFGWCCMISIVVHSDDYIWANAFKNYVAGTDNVEYEVIIQDLETKFDNLQNVVHLIDTQNLEAGDVEKSYEVCGDDVSREEDGIYSASRICEADASLVKHEMQSSSMAYGDRSVPSIKEMQLSGICIQLTENRIGNDDVLSICKYEPADELLGRLSKIAGSSLSSSKTTQYVFASGINTSSSWVRCKNYAKELSERKNKVLVISFSHFDVANCSKIAGDNFAKFAYYASVSDKRLAVHMRNLLVKSPSGYCVIPKPYLFDISQWSEFCTRSVINGVGYSDDFDVIIWHFDGIYAESFIPLYKICEKLFWTTIYHDLREDLSLKLLSDKCDRDFANTAKCFYEQHDERAVWS